MTAVRSTRTMVCGLAVAFGCLGLGCDADLQTKPGWNGPLSVPSQLPDANLGLGVERDGGRNEVSCAPASSGARPHEAGNYDTRSCNVGDCHNSMMGGGWVYTNPNGVPWVGGARITISNADGSIVTARSAADGFFQITGAVVPPYKVCVSECPATDCSLLPHPNAACQTSNCHGKPGQRIYVSVAQRDTLDAGLAPASDGGTGSCTQPASGGPYTHSEWVYGNQPCSGGGCHTPKPTKPIFEGGFLYDGPSSMKTVGGATITLVPSNGIPIKVVSGIDGMFFFGTVSDDSIPTPLNAPYTACVSKCPLTICSLTNGHTTTGDCQTSSCHGSDLKIYLR